MLEKQETIRKRPPWHLWVVSVVGLLWSSMGAFDYLMTQTKNEAYMGSFTPEQLDFYYSLPSWVVATWAIAVWGGVLGAVLLLLRRRLAVRVLLASLISMVLTTIHNYALSNGMEIMGNAFSLIFTAVIFLVALALFLYALSMKKKEILM